MSKCRDCKADIIWASTVNEKLMPVNAETDPNGNVELVPKGIGNAVHAVVHAQPDIFASDRHLAHFVTCPHADRWRKG